VIVTDSIAATELGAGTYRLGDREVRVTNSEARLGDGTLAGSVLTMDAAVRNLVSLGIAPVNALLCASTHPAKVIGRKDLGHLRPGGVADLVVLDDALCVKGTLVGGVEVFSA
jgi:N-acetylglucosamine-6-phosphate deacetylase